MKHNNHGDGAQQPRRWRSVACSQWHGFDDSLVDALDALNVAPLTIDATDDQLRLIVRASRYGSERRRYGSD